MRGVHHNLLRWYIAIVLLPCLGLLAQSAHAASAVAKSSDVAAQVKRDCARNPDALHLYTIGYAAVSRKPIFLVRVTAAAPGAAAANSPRLMVICRQHGDEPVVTQAALAWLARCAGARPDRLRQILGSTTVYLVPMANPDGADQLSRFTGRSGDMNRDWGVFALPETRALYAAYKQIKPVAVVDMHSWDLTDPFQANSVEAGSVASAANPQAAQLMQADVIKAIRKQTGQTVSTLSYSPEADSRLCHRFFAAQGVPAVLVETAAGPSDSRDEMAGRIQYALSALNGAVQIAPALAPSTIFAPPSIYLASADALAGRARPQAVIALKPGFTPTRIAAARKRAVRLALILYGAACAVMIAVSRKSLASALQRLARRNRSQVSSGYVSIRARRYPRDIREKTSALIVSGILRRERALRCR